MEKHRPKDSQGRAGSVLPAPLPGLPRPGRQRSRLLRRLLGAAHFSRRSGLCLLRHIFSGRSRAGSLCAACLAKPAAFTRARAILAYDEASRGAFLALKHADRLELVPGFARWLGRVGRSLLEDCDLIVLVPLHPARLWLRRYNQSAELARRLAREWNRPFEPLALVRSRRTLSQGAMPSARARRKNVLSVFKVPERERRT